MLGIDIYGRYQTVTNWDAVYTAGVRFVYVKATDGGAPAIVRADGLVTGAKSVGMPVGLYHYGELTPSPEVQADVLHGEVHRLNAVGLPPALDLEGAFHTAALATAIDFARRFLRRLTELGHQRVTLYSNTTFLSLLQPDSWNMPGLRIWAARYGANDGTTYPGLGSYTGRVDIHQWTDRGYVSGVTSSSGGVDLNKSLTNILEEDMPLTDDDINRVAAKVAETLPGATWAHNLTNAAGYQFPSAGWLIATNLKAEQALAQAVKNAATLQQLVERSPVDVDEQALAQALAPLLAEHLRTLSDEDVRRIAVAANDELARRQVA
jgi:GH25 family lysozyme M1 (1,4-beta-N-acetylmuramidase)